jgi:phospholipase/carboxylesterase
MSEDVYRAQLTAVEQKLERYLRAFERVQERLNPDQIAEQQRELSEAAGETFHSLEGQFAALAPPQSMADLHGRLCAALEPMAWSFKYFTRPLGPGWRINLMKSSQAFAESAHALYALSDRLPALREHWLLPGTSAELALPAAAAHGAPVGFTHRARTKDRSDYSLYIPEYYSAQTTWPVIICLHGGGGEGYTYILTWLRAARSRGYILLAPKSLASTWAAWGGGNDDASVLAMLDEVASEYSVDRSRIYLTGLSDGGTFTYLLGLSQHQLFAGIAPIAAHMPESVDPLLRQGVGKELPMLVVHGAKDYIFPVQFTRETTALLTELGYAVTYRELSDWGHAYTYTINETILMPWFEGLARRS